MLTTIIFIILLLILELSRETSASIRTPTYNFIKKISTNQGTSQKLLTKYWKDWWLMTKVISSIILLFILELSRETGASIRTPTYNWKERARRGFTRRPWCRRLVGWKDEKNKREVLGEKLKRTREVKRPALDSHRVKRMNRSKKRDSGLDQRWKDLCWKIWAKRMNWSKWNDCELENEYWIVNKILSINSRFKEFREQWDMTNWNDGHVNYKLRGFVSLNIGKMLYREHLVSSFPLWRIHAYIHGFDLHQLSDGFSFELPFTYKI